ncbi:lysophospholipid acyltransferase family protein [Streptomyces pathocidini]|uniref:Lysophospholipid acyltransferase family protein n=1 Tax=Streptomyces pathocidini TaxID=1650571 RepID=A0ABW7UKY8_9ACTN|nr:lysophospholipid acyltransferase family protein [Streptomyces pathocidini]
MTGHAPGPGPGGPWLPSAPCTPEDCLTEAAPAVPGPRRAARYLAGVAVLLLGIVLSPPARRCATARRDRLTARWCRAVVTAFGVRVRVVGGAAVPGALVVANHVSWLDIPVVAAVRPGRMVAKSEVGAYPVLGPLAARGATIFLDRDRLRALPGTVAEMAAALRRGSTVVAYPEGSTWCGRAQGRFRHAAFQAALDAGAPVQPLRIRYRLEGAPGQEAPTAVAAFVGEDTLLASLRRIVAARGLVAEVTVLPPIPAGTHADRRTLARAARAVVCGEPAVRGGAVEPAGAGGVSTGACPPCAPTPRRPVRPVRDTAARG